MSDISYKLGRKLTERKKKLAHITSLKGWAVAKDKRHGIHTNYELVSLLAPLAAR